jgi:hypothetical protein
VQVQENILLSKKFFIKNVENFFLHFKKLQNLVVQGNYFSQSFSYEAPVSKEEKKS